jgi:hypothetical protein
MATLNSPAILFDHDDPGYLAWLAANRGGFVINCHRQPVAWYLVLHRATCTWINPPRFRNWTTVGYVKVCAPTAADLDAWARDATGGRPKYCPACMRADEPHRDGSPVERHGTGSPAQALAPSRATAAESSAPALTFRSGIRVADPLARLLAFCREEYVYYDGIADAEPDRILPIDVLVTVAMNSFIDKAAQVRRIHRALALRCDPILPEIPADADLLALDADLRVFDRLIGAAVAAPEVLVPRAVKVLHRKRRNLVPMLDTVVLNCYLDAMDRTELKEQTQDKRRATAVAVEVLRAFREDLRHAIGPITDLRARLAEGGFPLTPVRILEVLVWTEVEPQGYYRWTTPEP